MSFGRFFESGSRKQPGGVQRRQRNLLRSDDQPHFCAAQHDGVTSAFLQLFDDFIEIQTRGIGENFIDWLTQIQPFSA